MDYLGLFAGLILILAAAIIIGIKLYKKNKETGTTISFDEFIEAYGQQIIQVLIDIIQLLKLDQGSYENKEEYEYTVIYMTIDKLKENSVELGIDKEIINMIDTETLTGIVQKVLHNEVMEIFNESTQSVTIGDGSSLDENDTGTSNSLLNEVPYTDEVNNSESE